MNEIEQEAQLTADEGSMEARMGMPPAGTRRPQTPAATGPDMMENVKLLQLLYTSIL